MDFLPYVFAYFRQLRKDNPDVSAEELLEMLGGNAARLFTRANLRTQFEARRSAFLAAERVAA